MKNKTRPKTGNGAAELSPGTEPLFSGAIPEVRLKRILVPIDFSESSRKAARYACSFAKQYGAEILLLHVVEPVPPQPEVAISENGLLANELEEEAAKKLTEWRVRVARQPMKTSVRTGIPQQEIVGIADEHRIDLIILGTHGRTGLAHFFLGSTAEQVVRHAPCPVMVVRVHEHDFLEIAPAHPRSTSLKKKSALKGTRYDNRTKEKRSLKSERVLRR
jgi:universal stress protein A